jgi:hypothetical protein
MWLRSDGVEGIVVNQKKGESIGENFIDIAGMGSSSEAYPPTRASGEPSLISFHLGTGTTKCNVERSQHRATLRVSSFL